MKEKMIQHRMRKDSDKEFIEILRQYRTRTLLTALGWSREHKDQKKLRDRLKAGKFKPCEWSRLKVFLLEKNQEISKLKCFSEIIVT